MLEVGFDYVCQKDDLVFLRKRKWPQKYGLYPEKYDLNRNIG
jgi:hypothetical protein